MPAPHRKVKPTLPDRREKDVRHLRSGCAPSWPGMAYIFARDVRHLHPGRSDTSPAAFSRRKKRIRQNSKPISLPLPAKALSWLPESREQDAPIFALPSYTTEMGGRCRIRQTSAFSFEPSYLWNDADNCRS